MGADVIWVTEGNILVKDGTTPGSRRGRGTGHVRNGVLQEPGRPCHLRLELRSGGAADLHRALSGRAWSDKGANNQALSGIRG